MPSTTPHKNSRQHSTTIDSKENESASITEISLTASLGLSSSFSKRDRMEDRTRLFQKTLRHKLANPLLVRKYQCLYYNSLRKYHCKARIKQDETSHNDEDGTNRNRDVLRLDTGEASKLTCFPWALKRRQDDTKIFRGDNDGDKTKKEKIDKIEKREELDYDVPLSVFMHESHLDLRHLQNTRWAEGRLEKGVEYAKLSFETQSEKLSKLSSSSPSLGGNPKAAFVKKAESCYREGLDMIPNHTGLCVAYGALCANDGRLELAKAMFQKALTNSSSPPIKSCNDCDERGNIYDNETCSLSVGVGRDRDNKREEMARQKNARLYLAAVEKRLEKEKKTASSTPQPIYHQDHAPTMSHRAEKALQDAMTERDFLMGPPQPPSLSATVSTASATIDTVMNSAEGTNLESDHDKNKRYRGIKQKTYDLLEEPPNFKDGDERDGNDDISDNDRQCRKRRKSSNRNKRKSSNRNKRRKTHKSSNRRGRRQHRGKHGRYDDDENNVDVSVSVSDSDDDLSSYDRQRKRRRRKHKCSHRTSNRRRRRRKRRGQSPSPKQDQDQDLEQVHICRSSSRRDSLKYGNNRSRGRRRQKRKYASSNSSNISSSSSSASDVSFL